MCWRGSARRLTTQLSISPSHPARLFLPRIQFDDNALVSAMGRRSPALYPRDAVVPYMAPGTTDSSFLRARGMPVYGVPVFLCATAAIMRVARE